MEILKMTSRPLGLFNAQRKIRHKQEQLLWQPLLLFARAHFRSQRFIHEGHDKTKYRFTFQLTNTLVEENISDERSATSFHNMLILFLKSENTKTSTLLAIVFYFQLNKRDKTNIIQRWRKTTLRFPRKQFQTFRQTANRLLTIIIFTHKKTNTTKKLRQ